MNISGVTIKQARKRDIRGNFSNEILKNYFVGWRDILCKLSGSFINSIAFINDFPPDPV